MPTLVRSQAHPLQLAAFDYNLCFCFALTCLFTFISMKKDIRAECILYKYFKAYYSRIFIVYLMHAVPCDLVSHCAIFFNVYYLLLNTMRWDLGEVNNALYINFTDLHCTAYCFIVTFLYYSNVFLCCCCCILIISNVFKIYHFPHTVLFLINVMWLSIQLYYCIQISYIIMKCKGSCLNVEHFIPYSNSWTIGTPL